MTQTSGSEQTDTEGNEIILEPGDPGYVDPNAPSEPLPEVPPVAAPGEAGKDLIPERGPREHEAEYLARTRAQVVESTSPTDVVPNMPQIRMTTETPPVPPEPQPEPDPAPEPEPEPTAP